MRAACPNTRPMFRGRTRGTARVDFVVTPGGGLALHDTWYDGGGWVGGPPGDRDPGTRTQGPGPRTPAARRREATRTTMKKEMTEKIGRRRSRRKWCRRGAKELRGFSLDMCVAPAPRAPRPAPRAPHLSDTGLRSSVVPLTDHFLPQTDCGTKSSVKGNTSGGNASSTRVGARARGGGAGTREGPRFALFRRKKGRSGRCGARREEGPGRRGRREAQRNGNTGRGGVASTTRVSERERRGH